MCVYKVSMVCNGTPYDLNVCAENKSNAKKESTIFMLRNTTWDKSISDVEKLNRIHIKSISEDFHI